MDSSAADPLVVAAVDFGSVVGVVGFVAEEWAEAEVVVGDSKVEAVDLESLEVAVVVVVAVPAEHRLALAFAFAARWEVLEEVAGQAGHCLPELA